MLCTH